MCDAGSASTPDATAAAGRQKLTNLQGSLTRVEAMLTPFLGLPRETQLAGLGGLDRAKLNAAMAYTTASLVYALLKVQGAPTTDHEVMSELKRVGQGMQKIKAAAAPVEAPPAPEPQPQPRLRVDASAGHRMVAHALASKATLPAASEAAMSLSSSSAAAADSTGAVSSQDNKRRDTEPAAGGSEKKKKKTHGKSASDFM